MNQLIPFTDRAPALMGSVEDTCKMSSQTGLRGANTLGEPSNQAS